jgi:hypothetical protein
MTTATSTFATCAVTFSEATIADHLVDHCQVADACQVTDATAKTIASLSQTASLTAQSINFTALVAAYAVLLARYQVQIVLKVATKAAAVRKDLSGTSTMCALPRKNARFAKRMKFIPSAVPSVNHRVTKEIQFVQSPVTRAACAALALSGKMENAFTRPSVQVRMAFNKLIEDQP